MPDAAAPSSDRQDTPHIVPQWRHRATGDDVYRVYPRRAEREGVSGIALVACKVTKDGDMSECVIEQEAPEGYGFGDAALALTPRFKMRPLTRERLPVEGAIVRLPLQFRLPR